MKGENQPLYIGYDFFLLSGYRPLVGCVSVILREGSGDIRHERGRRGACWTFAFGFRFVCREWDFALRNEQVSRPFCGRYLRMGSF